MVILMTILGLVHVDNHSILNIFDGNISGLHRPDLVAGVTYFHEAGSHRHQLIICTGADHVVFQSLNDFYLQHTEYVWCDYNILILDVLESLVNLSLPREADSANQIYISWKYKAIKSPNIQDQHYFDGVFYQGPVENRN